MDKETKVGSAAEMCFLPLVLFLAVYLCECTHTHTRMHSTARGMCVVERLKAPIHFCVFNFSEDDEC